MNQTTGRPSTAGPAPIDRQLALALEQPGVDAREASCSARAQPSPSAS
jgi:hypothetical protein